jgi:hypothetical protein
MNMDPNATLELIRRMLNANEEDMDVGELCCAVRDLDGWLCAGGFLPDAWKARRGS